MHGPVTDQPDTELTVQPSRVVLALRPLPALGLNYITLPTVGLVESSELPVLRSSQGSLPVVFDSSAVVKTPGAADFELLRSSLCTRQTLDALPPQLTAEVATHDRPETTSYDMSSSPLYFPSLNDVIGSHDTNSSALAVCSEFSEETVVCFCIAVCSLSVQCYA